MTEYKTFDDYVRSVFKIEPTELTHISPEEQKKKTVKITADELINIWNELSELEKACDETQELLDKQIEATYKLDKENAELKEENEEMKKDLGCETCQIHLEYKSLNNRIANLERENTELKAGRDINVFTKQLTKAKEIIKKLYSHVFQGMGFMELNDYNVQKAEAEQFLSEVEK